MSDRYQLVYKMPSKLFLEGCPVLLVAGAIQKDTKTDKILAQLKLRNISSKTIIACKVSLKAYSISNELIEGVEPFSYLDLQVNAGEDFGSKTPIYLPNQEIRKITAAVTQVVYSDNSIWNDETDVEWDPVPEQEPLENRIHVLGLIEQYKYEFGDNAVFYPEIKDGLFLCACGNINLESSERCSRCNRTYTELIRALDEDELRRKADFRLEKEREEQEENKRAEIRAEEEKTARRIKKKKTIRKAVIITVTCIVFVVALIFAVKQFKYNKAMKLIDAGDYKESQLIFESLGGYRDSEERILQCRYMQADDAMNNYDYVLAEEIFESLDDYRDSSERVESMHEFCSTLLENHSQNYNVDTGEDDRDVTISCYHYKVLEDGSIVPLCERSAQVVSYGTIFEFSGISVFNADDIHYHLVGCSYNEVAYTPQEIGAMIYLDRLPGIAEGDVDVSFYYSADSE